MQIGPSEAASIPLRRENKIIMGGRGGKDLGRRGHREGRRGTGLDIVGEPEEKTREPGE